MADMKELLGDDLFKQVTEKLGEKRIDVVNDGEWIPKDKFTNMNTEKNSYKDQVTSLNKELTTLQSQVKDNQAASDTVETLKKQIADKESELVKTRKVSQITLEAMKHNPHDVKDILSNLNHDSIVVGEDGSVAGLKEQIDAMVESKPYLFNIATAEPTKGTGGSLGAGTKTAGETKKDSANTFVDVIRSEQSRRK